MCIVSAAVTEEMKEMRNWGRSGMASCFLLFVVNQVHGFG